MTGIGRGINRRLAALESLQLIAGVSLPDKMGIVAPNTKAFMNDEGYFDGAYGPRIADQIPRVIDELGRDALSRRARVVIWREDELGRHSKDYPCTISIGFRIRDGKLTMKTHMRSNDVWWGWGYDLVQFASLQCTVASVLGLPPGPYVHHADSFHVYERNLDQLRDTMMKAFDGTHAHRVRITGIRAATWSDAQRVALSMLHGPDASMSEFDYPFYYAQRLWEV